MTSHCTLFASEAEIADASVAPLTTDKSVGISDAASAFLRGSF